MPSPLRCWLQRATRALIVSLACLTVVGSSSAIASAADNGGSSRPTAHSPQARALRALGVHVAWPLRRGAVTLNPGARIVVRIRPVGGGTHAAVSLALVRVDLHGRTLARIAAAKRRDGSFAVRLPRTAGGHYALTLRAGRLHYRGWIDTPTPPPPAPVTPPAPPFSGAGFDAFLRYQCGTPGASSVTWRLAAGTVFTNGSVEGTLTNTGASCIDGTDADTLERLENGVWTTVALPPQPSPPSAMALLVPGASARLGITPNFIFGGLLPSEGHYRLTLTDLRGNAFSGLPTALLPTSVEFDIVQSPPILVNP
jgi:hypothetical protein